MTSVSYVAPAWQVAMAKLFGERLFVREGNLMLTIYQWRGRLYVTDFTFAEPTRLNDV